MNQEDRNEIAAVCAGFHNLFALLVRRLDAEALIDLPDLLADLDRLNGLPGLHPLTVAVQEDARASLLPLLVRDPLRDPAAIAQADLQSVAPLRQSPGFQRHD